MEDSFIEMTIPDKPNSSLQKYRLTALGKKNQEKLNKMKFTEESLEIWYLSIINHQSSIFKSISMMLQFKIKLLEVEDPEVWRQILVPSQFTFHQFHQIIQEAFGWEDCHLYEFCPKGRGEGPIIGLPDYEEEEDITESVGVLLAEIFTKPGKKCIYNYDFGDGWSHEITLERITDNKSLLADCIGGKGICPPEDCGGPCGFKDIKDILNNPKHPEYKNTRTWLGLLKKETWETDNFDRRLTSKWLQRFSFEYLK